jgi:hypothetical protein
MEKTQKTIFIFWLGLNKMGKKRKQILNYLKNNIKKCDVTLINNFNYKNFIKPAYQLHPAFEYLSAVHKTDYLRCYFMHHYGGGYTDIKYQYDNWNQCFNKINDNSNIFVIGCKEKNIGCISGRCSNYVRNNWERCISNGKFIMKKQTVFTSQMMSKIHEILDLKLELLKKNPAYCNRSGYLCKHTECKHYPIWWNEILGEILHPLEVEYHKHILYDLWGINCNHESYLDKSEYKTSISYF